MIHLLQRLERITRHRYSLLTVASSLSIIWFILTITTIANYPSPMHDEVIWIGIARQFLVQGNFGWSSIPDLYGLHQNTTFVGRLFVLYIAVAFKLFGFGLLQARWALAVVSFACAILLGLSLQRLYSAWTGLLGAALYLFSWNTFYFSHYVRPEILGLLGGLGLLYWFICTHNKASPVTVVGWGLLNTLMLDTHLSYVHLLVALDLVIFIDALRRKSLGRIGWLLIGHIIGFLYWIVAHLAPDPLLMLKQLIAFYSINIGRAISIDYQSITIQQRFIAPLTHLKEYLITFTRLSAFEFSLLLIAIGTILRHSKRHWIILVPATSLLVTIFLLFPSIYGATYIRYLLPFLAAIMAVAAFELYASRRSLAYIYVAGLIVLWVAYIGGNAVLGWNNRDVSENYKRLTARIDTVVPPTANVLADEIWLYAFPRERFSTIRGFTLLNGTPLAINQSATQAYNSLDMYFAERKIDYVLFSEDQFAMFIGPESLANLRSYLITKCNYVTTIEGNLYGADVGSSATTITVYACQRGMNVP